MIGFDLNSPDDDYWRTLREQAVLMHQVEVHARLMNGDAFVDEVLDYNRQHLIETRDAVNAVPGRTHPDATYVDVAMWIIDHNRPRPGETEQSYELRKMLLVLAAMKLMAEPTDQI